MGRESHYKECFFHLAFLQAWTTDNAPSLAASSWFFSALLFCYALTPLISLCLDKASKRLHNAYAISTFVLLIAYQFLVSACDSGVFYENSYYCPAVRFFEYASAYALGCFINKTDYVEKPVGGHAGNLIQLCLFGVYLALAIPPSLHWKKMIYALLSMCLVVALVCTRGVVSRILEIQPLLWLSRYQTDAFFSHQNIIWWMIYLLPNLRFRQVLLLDLVGVAIFVVIRKAGQRAYLTLHSHSCRT